MFQKTIKRGSREVIISANTEVIISANTPEGPFTSTLYVNCGAGDVAGEPSMGLRAKAHRLQAH